MLNLFRRSRITRPVECPGCACDVATRVLVAYRKAGDREERAGVVLDCVRCGERYTALDAGGTVRYGRGHAGVHGASVARAGAGNAGATGATTGGAGDGAGASLFADMETLD